MRVLMVISQFYPIVGGTEKQAQLLGHALIKQGIDVSVVTGWWNYRTPRKETVDGMKVFRNFSCWGMFGIKGIRTVGTVIYMASLGIHLLVRRKEYDLIHVHQALYPAFTSVLVGKGFLQKPVVVKYACSGMTSDINQLKRFPLGSLQLNYLLKSMNLWSRKGTRASREFAMVAMSTFTRRSSGRYEWMST